MYSSSFSLKGNQGMETVYSLIFFHDLTRNPRIALRLRIPLISLHFAYKQMECIVRVNAKSVFKLAGLDFTRTIFRKVISIANG